MIRLSSYLQDEEPFYAHGHPDEICQQKLTGARRASRREGHSPTRLLFHYFWKEAAMDVISEIFDMIGDILELVITQVVKRQEAKENKQDNEKKGVRKDNV